MKIRHKNGAITGISFQTRGYRFWSALNEGGRYFAFNLLMLDGRWPSKNGKHNLIHLYAFGKQWNWWW